MTKKILVLFLIFIANFVYAKNNLETYFDIKEYPYDEIQITSKGWLEDQYLIDSDFSACVIYEFTKEENFTSLWYYPVGSNKTHFDNGKIQMNNQEFSFTGKYYLNLDSIKFYSIHFENRSFLLLLGDVEKYGDEICFIFDVTNPEHIIFYPPGERFVCKEMVEKFIGIFQGKLCFFFSTRRFEWNGQYKLIPYYLEDNELKELCDKNGNPFFVNYSYTSKYEDGLVIEEKNIPEGKK